jgi:hypothetical protein
MRNCRSIFNVWENALFASDLRQWTLFLRAASQLIATAA